jgi:hypothetical protein
VDTALANSSISSFSIMKKLFRNSIFFAAPFVLFTLLEILVLPIDTFTFRVWEAAGNSSRYLPGPFLPNLHIVKNNEGGDGRMPDGPVKRVEWFTDGFGYRNRPRSIERFDVVAVGDSNIAGSFLDQRNTFPETLERSCHCTVYNHAYNGPGDFERYLRQSRFVKSPPKLVLFEFRHHDVYDWKTRFQPIPDLPANEGDISSMSPWDLEWEIIYSHYRKQLAYNWARARLKLAITRVPHARSSQEATKSPNEPTAQDLEEVAKIFVDYKKRIEARGSRFAVLMVTTEFDLADKLKPVLERSGVDFLTFPRVPDANASYYHRGDSHWREDGVVAAAAVVAAYIRDKNVVEPGEKSRPAE